jgi:hypothetical protein
MASGAGDSGFRNLGLNHERRLVAQTFASWNRMGEWLRRLDAIRSRCASHA